MTDKDTFLTDDQLDDLFSSVTEEQPVPSADFMSRVFADIDLAQDELADLAAAVPPSDTSAGLFGQVWEALGGWFGAGGLAAVAVAGLWIGVAQPASFDQLTGALLQEDVSVSVFASADLFGVEG